MPPLLTCARSARRLTPETVTKFMNPGCTTRCIGRPVTAEIRSKSLSR
jgi:hypothetical protein